VWYWDGSGAGAGEKGADRMEGETAKEAPQSPWQWKEGRLPDRMEKLRPARKRGLGKEDKWGGQELLEKRGKCP